MKKEIGLYLIFGVLTTFIGIGGYALLLTWGFHYLGATTISWVVAVFFAYVTNRKFVFESKRNTANGIFSEVTAFFMSRLGTWILETLGLYLLIEYAITNQMHSKYIMSVVVVVLNYVFSKWVVFKRIESKVKNESEV